MAEACAALSKYDEAAALFERAFERTATTIKIFGEVGSNPLVFESKVLDFGLFK